MNPKVGYRNLWAEGEILAYSSEYGQAPVEGTQEPSVEFSWQTRHGLGSGNGRFVITAPTEMVTNGGFPSATTGWSPVDCSLASVAGGNPGNCLQLTRTAGDYQYAGQGVTLQLGVEYTFVAAVRSGTAGDGGGRLLVADNTWAEQHSENFTSSVGWTFYSVTFTPVSHTAWTIYLFKDSATAGTMLFDSASLIADGAYNNAIDFVIGSDMYVAYLTAGIYNGQTLAAEVVTQMNASSGGTFTCVYDEAAAKFTAARAAGNFSLLWLDGKHAAYDASGPLGFSAAANKISAATYTSDYMVSHTSESIDMDLGLNASYDFVGIRGHNLSSSAVITLTEASDAAFTTDIVTDTLTYSGNTIWQKLPATRTGRYMRLTVSDPANTSAYAEVGPVTVCLLQELNREFSQGYSDGVEDLSVVEVTQQSIALVTDRREGMAIWGVMFEFLSDASAAIIKDLMATKGVRPAWVLCLDSDYPGTNTYWVRIREAQPPQHNTTNDNTWAATLEEVT